MLHFQLDFVEGLHFLMEFILALFLFLELLVESGNAIALVSYVSLLFAPLHNQILAELLLNHCFPLL